MKRHSASIAGMMLLLPLAASAAGLNILVDGSAVLLRDVQEGEWFSASVKAAADADIISGYRDAKGKPTGLFGPGDPVTIAQALKMAVTGAGYDATAYVSRCDSGKCLTDEVLSKHWAAAYIAVAQLEDFGLSIDATTIDKRATRAQVAQITADAFGHAWVGDLENLLDYTDVSKDHRHAGAIAAVTIDDIMVGDGRATHCKTSQGCQTTTFRPDERINRAEAVKVIMTARSVHGTPNANGGVISSAVSGPQEEQGEVIVTYTDAGFAPSQLSVTQNTTVIFRNKSSSPLWVASDPHPVHTALPTFDAAEGIATNAEYAFRFEYTGTWGFHNHLQSTHKGTVTVLP